jgi:hypothetical protein
MVNSNFSYSPVLVNQPSHLKFHKAKIGRMYRNSNAEVH